ncbi:5-(carboxyamino)imidazole ribonucleotide synthase [Betaproteobacteria bacterium]|nr:5-(carboxyamino)imidazole ribonucleotide synthase [Betaproteobacteria bacterium]
MRIGLMGGGQLGLMMIEAAHKMGFSVTVFAESRLCPAFKICDDFIESTFTDLDALSKFRKQCDVFTVETENIPFSVLEYLAEKKTVCPNAEAIRVTQNRINEKKFANSLTIPTVPFIEITTENISNIDSCFFPGILKTARFGYDGKGQAHIAEKNQLLRTAKDLANSQYILEKKVPLDTELSIIIVRDKDGNIASYPLAENRHENGILAESVMPANVSVEVHKLAFTYGEKIAKQLDYVGVLTVEFFLSDGSLLLNEMAPRPHNSGHQTINASVTSQFEQQARICAGLPLGDTTLKYDVRLENILGDLWFSNNNIEPCEPNWEELTGGVKILKLYGKNEPRVGRKMGHLITLVRKR